MITQFERAHVLQGYSYFNSPLSALILNYRCSFLKPGLINAHIQSFQLFEFFKHKRFGSLIVFNPQITQLKAKLNSGLLLQVSSHNTGGRTLKGHHDSLVNLSREIVQLLEYS